MLVSIIAYQEARMLPMCLAHLPKSTRVRVVDGAFADYPHTDPHSTDGTIEIARRWGAEVVEVTTPWEDQCAKRTAALVPGEVVFCPDADEMLHSSMPELPEDADVGWVTCVSPLYDGPFLIPRVFRCREGWHFAGRHHWLYDGEGNLVTSHTRPGEGYRWAILPVLISNERGLRERCRDTEKGVYISRRAPKEGIYADESCVYPRPA